MPYTNLGGSRATALIWIMQAGCERPEAEAADLAKSKVRMISGSGGNHKSIERYQYLAPYSA